MRIETERRNYSLITGKRNLELLYELENFPVFIGCTSSPKEDDLYANMTWMICKDSGMIQLRDLLPAELVYSAYHSEGIGETWMRHHLSFCDFIKKYS
jgi:cathepsin L